MICYENESLLTRSIVIMDNLSIHQGACVRQAIEVKGCQLLFLPAYSPDLSPIEKKIVVLPSNLEAERQYLLKVALYVCRLSW
jgi:transposase